MNRKHPCHERSKRRVVEYIQNCGPPVLPLDMIIEMKMTMPRHICSLIKNNHRHMYMNILCILSYYLTLPRSNFKKGLPVPRLSNMSGAFVAAQGDLKRTRPVAHSPVRFHETLSPSSCVHMKPKPGEGPPTRPHLAPRVRQEKRCQYPESSRLQNAISSRSKRCSFQSQ
eukprot:1877520-Pleurochrysis_carterae.AAC.1